jgi:PAS domain S-box-containing protein
MERLASLMLYGIRRARFRSLSENLAEGAIVFNSKTSNSARPVRLIVVGGLLLIGAIIATTTVLVINLRDRAIAEAGRELRNLALVLGEQTNRNLQSVELAETNIIDRLRLVYAIDAEGFQRIASSSDADATLKNAASNSPQLDALTLINSNGSLVNSSRNLPLVDADVAGQDYFRALKANPTLTSFISDPTYVRSTQRWTIHIARQVRSVDGQFLGLLLGAIQLRYFEELYQRVSLNEDSTVALLGNDGLLLARYPRADDRIGKSLANNPLFRELIASANIGSVRLTSQVDGKDRIFMAHRLENYPIVLSVGTTVEAALSNWRNSSLYAICAAVLLIVVTGGITAFSARQIAVKLRTHNLRLNTALNNMSQGLVMFDGTGHLVICNQRYLQMYDLPPERVRRCRTLRDILCLRVERGTYPGNPDQAAATLQHTIGQAKSGQHTTNLKDGRSIKVTNEPMPGGGWVSTHDDITELRRARTFLDTIIENVPVPIIVKTVIDQRCTLINHAAEEFFAVSREDMIGKVAHEVYSKERADIIVARDNEALRSQSPVLFSEHTVPGPKGEIRRVKSTKVVVGGDDGSPQFLISLLEDVTEKSEGERRIAHMAHHDVLTDLPNRAFFNERLAATIANAEVATEHFAIMFMVTLLVTLCCVNFRIG